MKVVMKPIDMIVWFNQEGKPRPIKYRFESEEGNQVIKVDNVLTVNQERLAGNIMLIFKCQSIINGIEKIYELKYEKATCKWFLYKI
ncbi:hypothetical protein [Anaerobranca gottschalkii]|uniref:Uncharacterized protein n=1 Tax=Anaerobranca gottschalkii DSM 13577 TaxID=1120990 RepID=A0A1I0BF60_9FIRM|nr:hypothetical protein [Anaerobranca gottschalkii]SET05600.1 hypothetical protein SAMN03080614_10393 [Anaerobranca gottschalkii DSM 13577]